MKTLHFYSNNGIPEGQGTSAGTLWGRKGVPYQASSKGSLNPNVGGKGCIASSEYLPSWPITCCTDWLLTVSGWECCLKETVGRPCRWVLLLLTRNDRGIAGWWLGELMGGTLKKLKSCSLKSWSLKSKFFWCYFLSQMSHTCSCVFSYDAKAWGFLNKYSLPPAQDSFHWGEACRCAVF